jgi:hypothetical protein
MNSDFDNNYITLSHDVKRYDQIISTITRQKYKPTPLRLSFKFINSSDYNKYHLKLKNFFFYKINGDTWKSNIFLSYTSKYMKYIKFDIFPNVKLIITNDNLPIKVSIKHGKYQSARDQNIVDYDFSRLLKSMLPYHKTGLNIEYFNRDINYYGYNSLFTIFKIKGGYNKIFNFEDNIKLLASAKVIYDINNLTNLFNIQISNQLNVKKSFIDIFEKKKKNESKDFHITSGFDFKSKILGFNFLEQESVIDNRSNFLVQNHMELRLKDFSYLKKKGMAVFEPFIGIECLFVPIYNKDKINWENSIKLILNAGISIRLNEHMTFDIALQTWAKSNPPIKKELLNRFRINVNISSNLEK